MNDTMTMLQSLRFAGLLRDIDVQFADFARRVVGGGDAALLFAAALVSHAVGEGHACLDLAEHAARPFPGEAGPAMEEASEAPFPGAPEVGVPTLPPLGEWLAALNAEMARPLVGSADAGRPLVLDGTRLYLRRYWNYERLVAARLAELAASNGASCSPPGGFEELVAGYFPVGEAGPEACNPQRAAACNAVVRQLSILSGGPGTGKTYTLSRIVALLAEIQPRSRPLRVRIAAPTGKAAARVVESMRGAKETLKDIAPPAVLEQVPEEASTLHRLLGAIPDSPYFRHDRHHPLDADLVVVDEASMVDLPLMAKLLDALPGSCRLMLVGDRYQLASVEPGRVYGDLCEAALHSEALQPCMTELIFSHRFKESPEIGQVAASVKAGGHDAWGTLLACTAAGKVLQHDVGSGGPVQDAAFGRAVRRGFGAFLDATEPRDVLKEAARFRVLCAVRRGACGVQAVNQTVEKVLGDGSGGGRKLDPSGLHYDHRLILITVNSYSMGLFNGDVGVVLANARTHGLEAWFEADRVPGQAGGVRAVPVGLLPNHETAFAMTVHKSQGSEFERVALVLPPDGSLPALTRELLYTGVTRARSQLELWCTRESYMAAVARRTCRPSGLTAGWLGSGGPVRTSAPDAHDPQVPAR